MSTDNIPAIMFFPPTRPERRCTTRNNKPTGNRSCEESKTMTNCFVFIHPARAKWSDGLWVLEGMNHGQKKDSYS